MTVLEHPVKSGGLNWSMQHRLIEVLKTPLFESPAAIQFAEGFSA